MLEIKSNYTENLLIDVLIVILANYFITDNHIKTFAPVCFYKQETFLLPGCAMLGCK
jgi:hypothetical protein